MSINLHIMVKEDDEHKYEVSLSCVHTRSAASSLGFDEDDLSSRDLIRDFPLKIAMPFIQGIILYTDGALRSELHNVAAYIRNRPNSLLTIGWW